MMTLGLRKIILLMLIGSVFLMANIVLVANWLSEKGLPDFANHIRSNYLTGTAITVVVALLILLVNPGKAGTARCFIRRCPVCDRRLLGNPKYCSECGSNCNS
ncbi:MAG: hypothetical protein PHP01_00590 [Phycisphaerae bacterium]|nr:hypothetical protein [Phycisphaerae bacterium]